MRPQETRSFADMKEVSLESPEERAYWAEHLEAQPEEIADAVAKVGTNKTAVELFLGVAEP